MRNRLAAVANALIVFVALLVLWQLLIWIFQVAPFMLPSPLAVLHGFNEDSPVASGYGDHRD